ncbi:MAG: hypothetical protein ABI670_17735 [Chloroflexota bacterium]
MKDNSTSPAVSDTIRLAAMLREQGEEEQDIATLARALSRLQEWQAPAPTAVETTRLLSALTPLLPTTSTALTTSISPASPTVPTVPTVPIVPAVRSVVEPSPVRQALLSQSVRPQRELTLFFNVALAQVGLLRPAFWIASAAIVLVGTLAVLSGLSVDQAFTLRALGPLLAVISINSLVRSANLRVLEIEMSCPVSPVKLALARLMVVLGYDIALGLIMSLLLWGTQGAGASLLRLTLHWLAPLLLVAGAALLLSIRMHPAAAASTAYAGWLLVLSAAMLEGKEGVLTALLTQGELVLLIVGGCLLFASLLSVRKGMPAMLQRG